MTDNRMAEMLYLFKEIDTLMVANGARSRNPDGSFTTFDEKVNSFDGFEKEAQYPGDIEHMFKMKEGKYVIREEYMYDAGIKKKLLAYENYKTYEKRYEAYKKKILGGNYNTLKSIAIVRRKVLHVREYKVWKYKAFKQDCQSMIKYLKAPDKKPFLSHYTLPKKMLAGTVALAGLKGKQGLKKHSLWQSIRSAWGETATHTWYKDILTYLGGLFAILYGLFYVLSKKMISIKNWDAGSYVLFAIGLLVFLYLLPKIMRFMYRLVASIVSWGKSSIGSDWYKMVFLFLGGAFMIYLWLQHKGNLALKKPHITEPIVKHQYRKPIEKKHSVKVKTKTAKPMQKQEKLQCRTAYVAVDTLHIRKNPNSRSAIIDKVYRNNKLCIVKQLAQWSYIWHRGWVYSEHISKTRVKRKRKTIPLGTDLY